MKIKTSIILIALFCISCADTSYNPLSLNSFRVKLEKYPKGVPADRLLERLQAEMAIEKTILHEYLDWCNGKKVVIDARYQTTSFIVRIQRKVEFKCVYASPIYGLSFRFRDQFSDKE